jgi:hypothetical protein
MLHYINDECIVVGEIDLTVFIRDLVSFVNEKNIGDLNLQNKVGNCFICVYGNEGPVPHFHIKSKRTKDFECCIEIYNERYFDHGSKTSHLNGFQLEILDNWLRLQSKYDISKSNWQYICFLWKQNNGPLVEGIKERKDQPDYKKTV